MDFGTLIPWREKSQVPAQRDDFLDPFVSFRREVDRMFDEFFNGFGGRGLRPMTTGWQGVTPTIDVAENDKEVVVTAELPVREGLRGHAEGRRSPSRARRRLSTSRRTVMPTTPSGAMAPSRGPYGCRSRSRTSRSTPSTTRAC